MKKWIALFLAIIICTTGCGKKNGKDIIKTFSDKVNSAKSYTLKGNMEIYADDEVFTYSIEANHLQENFYKVIMVNQTNNHEQVLLRNNDAVYVITPSLNKSFKFQSEWPNNSSQSYLLKSIVNDLNNDTNTSLEEDDDSYVIKSTVNYPNNPELKYQKVTLDKNGEFKKNEIYDENDKIKMKVVVTSVEYNASLKESDFKLEEYITDEEPKTNSSDNKNNSQAKDSEENEDSQDKTSSNKSTTDETKKEESNSSNKSQTTSDSKFQRTCTTGVCEETQSCEGETCQTGSLKDILYPLYIPSNTYLSTSDKVDTDNGNRVILTFGGEKNFVLVEEQAMASDEFEITPVYGDPLMVNDTIGAMGANSLTWTANNINYYLAGNDLTNEELLLIGSSIRYGNMTVSKEK